VIVLGAGRFGGALLGHLREAGWRVLIVDFDPRVVEAARAEGHLAIFGDAENPELPAALPLERARCLVCTVRRREVGLGVLHALAHHGYSGQIVLSAHHPEDAEALSAGGAHHILRPYEAAAAEAMATVALILHRSGRATPPPERSAGGARPARAPRARTERPGH
jgi:Trk K+ transport system NAD-binding subunit